MSSVKEIKSFQEQRIETLLDERPSFLEDERVAKAIGYLRETGEYEVFVRNERRISSFTVRDLISTSNPLSMKLGSVSYSIPEVSRDDSIADAARLMFDYRLRALPLHVKDGKVTVISAKSIMRAMNDSVRLSTSAADIMTPHPVTIEVDDTALKAKDIMVRRSFDHLPVMKSNKLYGIVTSSNLLFNLLPEERVSSNLVGVDSPKMRFDYAVTRIAEESVVEVDPTARLQGVMERMVERNSSYALVKLWDEIQGIITLRDILKPLVKRKENNVPYYIVGLPNEPFEAESAKMKLERLGNTLTRAFPSIREIRAIVKTKEVGHDRRRYEVSFSVYLSRGMYSYVEDGYDLSEVFDKVSPKLKRILGGKQSKVTRSAGHSVRKS